MFEKKLQPKLVAYTVLILAMSWLAFPIVYNLLEKKR